MRWLQLGLGLGYPFLVFAGLQWLEARQVALGLVAVFLLRWATRWQSPSREAVQRLAVPAVLVGAVLGASVLWNDEQTLLLVPVAVNAALLVAFGRTLVNGPPLVETFARLQVPDLPPDEVRYCRSVTILWCLFFLANGAVCAWLGAASSTWAWTVYTGFVSYLLIALLFGLEFVVRAWRFGRYAGTPLEPLFRRLFRPPPDDPVRPGG